jgi:hypothetical protein
VGLKKETDKKYVDGILDEKKKSIEAILAEKRLRDQEDMKALEFQDKRDEAIRFLVNTTTDYRTVVWVAIILEALIVMALLSWSVGDATNKLLCGLGVMLATWVITYMRYSDKVSKEVESVEDKFGKYLD